MNFTQWELATASKLFSAQTAWVTPPCPKCKKYFTKRVAAEDATDLASTLNGLLSYRCQLCGELFRAFPPASRGSTTDAPPPPTRRHYVRVPVNFPVKMWPASQDQPLSGTITEIALGGCCVETAAALSPGTRVRLELSVHEGRTPLVIRQATVSTIRPNGVGLEFTNLQVEEHLLLGRIMEELLVPAIADCRKAVTQLRPLRS